MARKVGTQGLIDSKSYIAEAANLQRGFCMIKGATEGGCNTNTVAGGACLGILSESTVNIGDGAPITRFGDSIAFAGSAIAYGAYVKSDATGRVVPLTGATGEQAVGRAESIASTFGDEIVIYVGRVPSGSGGSGGGSGVTPFTLPMVATGSSRVFNLPGGMTTLLLAFVDTQFQAIGGDYTIAGTTVTFTNVPGGTPYALGY